MELAEQGNRPMSDARQSVVCINQGRQMKAPGKLFLRPAWQGPDRSFALKKQERT